jgi:hypothetical protein
LPKRERFEESSARDIREDIMRVFAILAALLIAAPAVAQEKYVNSDASVRTILSYKLQASAVQKHLPEGWEVDAASSGPAAGSNLRITFIETLWGEDAQGKPMAPNRTITVGIPAKKKDGNGLLLIGGLTATGAPGAYGVYARASITSQRALRIDSEGAAVVEESWDTKGDNGDAISLQLSYVRGTAERGKIDARVYSGAKPEFYRIYRYTQAVDVLRAAGTDRVKAFTFKASGQKLGTLFDGSEQLVSIVALPYYSRQVYLPGS